MKQKLIVFAGLFLIILIFGFFIWQKFSKKQSTGPSLPIGQTHQVVLHKDGFVPNELTIKAGDVVEFRTSRTEAFWPASDLHPTHGIYPEFDPLKPLEPTEAWTFQFTKSGRWKYHDHLQPTFRGVIVVQ